MTIQRWIEQQAGDNRPLRWIVGPDTGASSKAVWAHMMGVEPESGADAYPADAGDLGRCIRLLRLMPEWQERMPEMAQHGVMWEALIANWPILVATYEANEGKGHFGAVWELMRQIIDPILEAQFRAQGIRWGK